MKNNRANSAFTLIELLTVIAIIGILAAILIPVVGRVRESAHNSHCISNLRQIGMGMVGAIGDNGGRFVDLPRHPDGSWPWNNIVALMVTLDSYLEEGVREGELLDAHHAIGVWRCPTVDNSGRTVQWPYYPSGWLWIGSDSQNLGVGRSADNLFVPPTRFPMVADRGVSGDSIPMTGGDWGRWSLGNQGSAGFDPRDGWHSGNRLNVVFTDGSVQSYAYVRGQPGEFTDILQAAQPNNWQE